MFGFEYTIFFNLAMAMLLGMIIGAERLYAHKTASMRTYALVSMGSALFVSLALFGAGQLSDIYPEINPFFMIAQIITGVGFLGAGLIIYKNDQLVGVTSATGLWVSAGIGIACGFGMIKLALMATLLVLFIFIVLWYIEQKLKKIMPETQKED